MSNKVIVFGDIELGAGTITDDFIADKTLSRIIEYYAGGDEQIDLVLNGDTFDFLKCPKIVNNESTYPRHITADISLHKLNLIFTAHPLVIGALRHFAEKPNHHIYFIFGNHDPDLKFPEVQKEIKKELQAKSNIHFDYNYYQDGLHVEHGDAYDFLHQQEDENQFTRYRGKKILNLPFVSFGLIDRFMVVKEEHPFLERIKPESEVLRHHSDVAKMVQNKTVAYFMKSIFYYPVRHIKDPTYRFPRGLFEEFILRIKAKKYSVDSVVPLFKIKNAAGLKGNEHKSVYVLGHRHELLMDQSGKNTIIHSDTWRDEYIFDPKTKKIYPKDKHYLEIVREGKEWTYKLHTQRSSRPPMDFDYATKHELEAAVKAASEEGYEPPRLQVRHK